jgi:hypothetical protein
MSTNLPPNIEPTAVKSVVDIVFSGFTAVGTVLVAILAIWGDRFRSRFAPALLTMEIHDADGDLTFLSQPGGNRLPTYFYHLKVKNKRPWISPKNCRVLLKAMSKRGPDGLFHSIPMSVPLQYVWAPSEITPPVIAIEHEQILDFGIVTEANRIFVPMLYSQSNNFLGFVRANEAIRYSLQIVSDAFVSKRYQVFEVAFDGTWSSERLEMKNHLRIREITESNAET